VRRAGQTQQLTLRTARPPLWTKIIEVLAWLLLVVFPLTGLIVFWLKRDNKQALMPPNWDGETRAVKSILESQDSTWGLEGLQSVKALIAYKESNSPFSVIALVAV